MNTITPDFSDQPKPSTSLASIVILTCNQRELTRACLESIRKHTASPYEVIVVDNASTDGTVADLEQHARESNTYKVIFNSKNRGYPFANNQGIVASRGDFVILLNNDVVVTDGWLEGLIECARSHPRIGIVGPMTNYISGPQCERGVAYRSMDEMQRFATRYRTEHRYQWREFPRITGFCMLVKRELIEKIGGLDPLFGMGNCEDDDFCLRSIQVGYKNMIAGDVFIHHVGSQYWVKRGLDRYRQHLEFAQRLFVAKWGLTTEQVWRGERITDALPPNVPLNAAPAEECFVRACQRFDQGMIPQALELLSLAEHHWTELQFPEEKVSLFDIEVKRGDCWYHSGKLEEAKQAYLRALRLRPHFAEACYSLGLCFERIGLPAAAREMFEEALQMNPAWARAQQKVSDS